MGGKTGEADPPWDRGWKKHLDSDSIFGGDEVGKDVRSWTPDRESDGQRRAEEGGVRRGSAGKGRSQAVTGLALVSRILFYNDATKNKSTPAYLYFLLARYSF